MVSRNFALVICFISLTSLSQHPVHDSLAGLLNSSPEQEHAMIYNEVSKRLFEDENFRESAGMALKALKLAKKYHSVEEEYQALISMAYIHYDLGEMDTSIFFAQEALKIAEQNNKVIWRARIYNHLGNSYSRISVYDRSLFYFLESMKIVEDTLPETSRERNQYYKSLLLNNIGTVYKNMGQYDIALDYFNRSLTIRRKLLDLNGIASCLQNIGTIYEYRKNYDTTLILYKEALVIRDSLKQQGYVAELLLNMSVVFMNTARYERAEEKLQQAVRIFGLLDKKRFLSFSYLKLADLYMQTGKPESAYAFIQRSIEISAKHNFKVYERDGYQLLSMYYANQGDYREAWACQNRQMALTDSVFSTELTSRVAEMRSKYETEKMEDKIILLSRDNEIQSLKIKRKSTQVYILVFIAVVFFLLLLVTFLLMNRRHLKQKQIKSELEKSRLLENRLLEENAYQSKQLTTHALNMLQKNNLLQALDNELKTFSTRADDALKIKLRDIRRQINRNMNSENDWELFKLYFEEVNKEFFSSLQEKSRELTTGDLKLAALIKLNLSIKEAAAVLNISPDSLRKSRYRLRKKLGLHDRQNLADFLSSIN
ncbi:MAG: tetratricopeptide repeat protein [Bacteroidales bacterium]|nr:tetratricopeptide repeat protein [Bacteroidales bacterium]